MRCARPTGWVVFLVIAVAPLGARAELPDELAAAAAGAVREGVETDPRGELSPTSPWPHVVGPADPHVIRPLRAEEPMATMQFDVPMPVIRQRGDKTNCGPTTAAMALAAFQKVSSPGELRALRDTVGEWSWQAFPLRQMRLPGYDAGMTTRAMMKESLERFGVARWTAFEHPWIPLEAWSVIGLKQAIAERRPVVVLAEAAPLWGLEAPGLHWVVVHGFERGEVIFNDPADGAVTSLPIARFWDAWRLSDAYRSLPMVAGFEALVPDRSLPVVNVAVPRVRADALGPRRF